MKRLKQLLVIGLVAAMTLSLTACGTSYQSISVDSSAAKTEYYVGEEFSSDGIVVTATNKKSETTELTSSEYTVDSTAYDSTTAGTYAISVAYKKLSTSYDVTVVVAPATSLTLDTSAITTEYYVGQTPDYSKLTATAAVADGTTKTLSYSDLTLNTSAVDNYTAGSYKVTASYTLGGATVSDEFVVTILDHTEISAGLSVTKTTVDYIIASGATSVDVSIDDLAVYLVEDDVVSTTALDSGSYALSYYKGDTQIESLSGLTIGKYQIWATAEYTVPDAKDSSGNAYTYTISDWVYINVLDEVQSIVLKNADTGTFTQESSTEDEMTATWEYTITYASGNTATIYGTDANLSFEGLVTNIVASSATATVTYTDVDAKGVSKEVSCEVTYSITESATASNVIVSVDFTDTTAFTTGDIISDTATEPVSLTYADGTATGFYVTKCSSSGKSNTITTKSSIQCLQMQGSAKATQNSLSYTLAAGTYIVTVSYYTDAKDANAGRYAVVLDSNNNELSGTITDAEKTDANGTIITREMIITLSADGNIYIGSKSSGLYFTAVSIKTNELVSVDFTDTTAFTTGDIISDTATEPVSLTYADGTATGFYVTKCSSSGKSNTITTKSSIQCLQMQGSAKATQNSLSYTLAAGTYIVTVSYYTDAKDANAGRYAVVLDSNNNELSGTITDAEKTDANGTIITREMTITLSDDGNIYIGSKSSGLYFTAVSICVTNAAS